MFWTFTHGNFFLSEMCDFESSLCGWTVEKNKKENFYWHRGSNLGKGPARDHTTMSTAGKCCVQFPEELVEKHKKILINKFLKY